MYTKFGKIDRYLLIGCGQLLFDVALALKNNEHEVCVVTSQRHLQEPVNAGSSKIGLVEGLAGSDIQHHLCEDVNSNQTVADLVTDQTLGISISSPWIFEPSFISKFNGRLVNVHCNTLPIRRGALAGYSWEIMDNQKDTGYAIHLVDAGIITGDILTAKDFRVPSWCRTPNDHVIFVDQEVALGVKQFIEDVAAEKEFSPTKLLIGQSFKWPQLNTDKHGFIDWEWTLDEIDSFIRAFDEPYKGASTFLGGERVYLKNCSTSYVDGTFHPFKTGLIFRKTKGILSVAAKEGTLVIRHICDGDGTSIYSRVRTGDRLCTSRDVLDRARGTRAGYDFEGLEIP